MIKKLIKQIVPRSIINKIKNIQGLASFHLRKIAGKPIKKDGAFLHLGCGDIRLDGFINVDYLKTKATDIVADVTKLECFEDSSARLIYACQVLEHFSHDEVPKILRRWYQVLAPGGMLRISVPDLDKIVKIYMKNWDHFRTGRNSPWIGLIYGGQKDEFDFHKTGFNPYWLKVLLSEAGFVQIEEYPNSPHFLGQSYFDGSMLTEPFGEFITLNMKCVKPH